MNTINKQIQQPSFSSRCPEIRDAQWVCQKVKSFPHISSTKVTIPVTDLAYKHPDLYNKFTRFPYPDLFKKPEEHKIVRIFEWQKNLVKKMSHARDDWGVLRKGDFKTVGAILGQFKYNRLGNCGEDAFLSAAILRLNGIKNAYTASIKIDKYSQDHAVCAFNRSGKPYSGKIERDTIIIDPWIGVADFASNVFQKYKDSFSKYFVGLNQDSKIFFDNIRKFNISGEEEFLLSIRRPELLYPESNRCFMQKK